MKAPPVVFVRWIDSGSLESAWTDREEAIGEAAALLEPLVAAGFLLADTQEHMVLALLYNPHHDHVSETVVIPKLAVIEVTRLLEEST